MSTQSALVELLQYLASHEYEFVAVTPATHTRVLDRPFAGPASLRDIFGWNQAFQAADVEPALLALLNEAEAIEAADVDLLRSRVRVACVDGLLFAHSAFPTVETDAVFFGPDTYRFWRFLQKKALGLPAATQLVDMGTGSGAGGILGSPLFGKPKVTLVDVNQKALDFAGSNAAAADVDVELVCSAELPDGADLVIANPPYLMDDTSRTYRDGGEVYGGAMSIEWATQALERMWSHGTLLMYTGAAFVDGEAPLIKALQTMCAEANAVLTVEELDPDVFGEELRSRRYADVERIAAVGVRITKT